MGDLLGLWSGEMKGMWLRRAGSASEATPTCPQLQRPQLLQRWCTRTPLGAKRLGYGNICWQKSLFSEHSVPRKWGFPCGSVVKNPPAIRRCRFDPWVGKIPWRGRWQPTLVLLPEKSVDTGDWQATVLGLAKSWTGLKQPSTKKTQQEKELGVHQLLCVITMLPLGTTWLNEKLTTPTLHVTGSPFLFSNLHFQERETKTGRGSQRPIRALVSGWNLGTSDCSTFCHVCPAFPDAHNSNPCLRTREFQHQESLKKNQGTSPVVWWLRLCTSSAGGMGSIRGRGTKIPHAIWHGQSTPLPHPKQTTANHLPKNNETSCHFKH